MRQTLKIFAAAMLSAATIAPANAAELRLDYRFASTGKTATIDLSGTLGLDGNTFTVTAFNGYKVDGVAVMGAGPSFDSADDAYGATTVKVPTLTLDGSYLDFIIFNGPTGHFVLGFGNLLADACRTQLGISGGCAGAQAVFGGAGPSTTTTGGFEQFDHAGYSATLVNAAVPEPATWALMIVGFGGVGSAMRRRRPARAVATV